MAKTIWTSGVIGDLHDMVKALNLMVTENTDKIVINTDTVQFQDPFLMALVEKQLTDGSTVYDIVIGGINDDDEIFMFNRFIVGDR